jgi:hypothetical protein
VQKSLVAGLASLQSADVVHLLAVITEEPVTAPVVLQLRQQLLL